MLGNPGSNPLELFWDVVDNLDQKLDAKILVVEEAIRRWNEMHVPAESEGEKGEKGKDKEGDGDEEGEKKGGNEKERDTDKDTGVRRFKVVPETTKEELLDILKEADVSKELSDSDLDEIYKTVCLISISLPSHLTELEIDCVLTFPFSGSHRCTKKL